MLMQHPDLMSVFCDTKIWQLTQTNQHEEIITGERESDREGETETQSEGETETEREIGRESEKRGLKEKRNQGSIKFHRPILSDPDG